MKEKIIKLIAKTLDINPKDINEKTNLVKDLEVESLDLVDLVAKPSATSLNMPKSTKQTKLI